MGRYVLLVVLLEVLSGCTSTSSLVPGEKQARIQSAHSIVFLSDIDDRIFGTRLSGLFMKPTDDFQTGWNSNEILGETVARNLTRSGRKIDVVPMEHVQFREDIRFDSINAAFSGISRELSRANPQSDADIHLILLHVPVDPVPHPVTGANLRMIGQGMIGLMWELGTTYKRSYVVRVNSDLNAIAWGKAQCIIVYALAAIDAHTHEVIQRIYPRWAEHPLPDDFWISDFQSLGQDDRNILRNSCLEGLTMAVEEDLGKLGLR